MSRRTVAQLRFSALRDGQILEAKKVGNNRLVVHYADGSTAYRLHDTAVVWKAENGKYKVSTGGWATPTTVKAINEGLDYFGLPGHVFVRDRCAYYNCSEGLFHLNPSFYSGESGPTAF